MERLRLLSKLNGQQNQVFLLDQHLRQPKCRGLIKSFCAGPTCAGCWGVPDAGSLLLLLALVPRRQKLAVSFFRESLDPLRGAGEGDPKAARLIFEELQIAPRNLTAEFVVDHNKIHCTGMLRLAGLAWPCGRGEAGAAPARRRFLFAPESLQVSTFTFCACHLLVLG